MQQGIELVRRLDLQKLLTEYAPATAPESEYRERMLRLLDATRDPFSRHQYEPGHFTASAFVLDPSGGRLLLVQHKKLGRWLQPGGHIEATDPTLLDAALREAREETGLEALLQKGSGIFDLDIHEIPPHGDAPAHLHFDLRMLLQAETDLLEADAPGAVAEVSDVRWVAFREILQVTSDESVLRAVAKLQPAASS